MGQVPRPRPERLAEKLRQIRLQLRLTQEELAGRLEDIPTPPQPGHVSEFEGGRREPSLFYLLAIARLAGIPMEILVDDDLELPNRLTEHALRMRPLKQQRKKKTKVGSRR